MVKTAKILLVSTGYSPANEIDSGLTQLQLGQLYLATVLEEKGYRVHLYSNLFPEPEIFINFIKKEDFDIIGFYSTTDTIERVKALIEVTKNYFPEKPVFLGGPHPTVMDREILQHTRADLVMRHEAEYTFPKVLEYYFDKKNSLDKVKGITFKRGDEIIRTGQREFIKNLDDLPVPDWNLLKGDLREINHKYPSVMTGRGCPFKCAFCFEAFGGNSYRLKSGETVMKEIDLLLENWDVKYIKFVDDTFVVNPKRVEKICNELKKRRRKHEFFWFCEARVDILNKRLNLLKNMKEAGLILIQIGVESGNQNILDLYEKDITLEEIENVVKACVREKIFCISINVIIGGPLESKDTLKNTTDFIKKLIKLAPGRVFCQSSLLTPYPSTPIEENPEKYGLVNIDPSLLGGHTEETCFMETESLNRFDIYRARVEFQTDVLKTMIEESENMTHEQIEEHIYLTEFGINTLWFDILMDREETRKYFHLKSHSLYKSIYEIDEADLDFWCPFRTGPLEYKGKKAIFKDFSGITVLSEEETLFYEYSGGKLSFNEIVNILSEEYIKSLKELKKDMIQFYKKMDKRHSIIFSRI